MTKDLPQCTICKIPLETMNLYLCPECCEKGYKVYTCYYCATNIHQLAHRAQRILEQRRQETQDVS